MCAVRRTRCGFTITELLVVITIIGMLIALLLPAVMSAREAARRVTCQSNLRQLGIAVHSFHSAHGRFPPGQCGGEYGFGLHSRCWSWLARLLPYLEQMPLYEEGDIPHKTLAESGIAHVQLPILLCPSDGYSAMGPRLDAGNLEGFPTGQTNYKAVSGANWGADESQDLDDIGTRWRNRGTNGSYDGHAHGDGIMWRGDIRYRITFAHVFDGLSNTLMIGEDLPEYNLWCAWPYASNAYGTCAIPPNHIDEDPGWWPNTHSFRSRHGGGLNFAFGDGAVRFLSDTIDLELYRALATRNGEEPIELTY